MATGQLILDTFKALFVTTSFEFLSKDAKPSRDCIYNEKINDYFMDEFLFYLFKPFMGESTPKPQAGGYVPRSLYSHHWPQSHKFG